MLKLNLIVIRTENPQETIRWYSENFGLEFIAESHEEGVLHYAAELSEGVLEIYPTSKPVSKITFGFGLNKSDFEKIALNIDHKIIGEDLILVKDIDGNSIILSLS